MKPKHALYISYDGLTDPLGQSQVIPYLNGIRQAGYKLTVISFEKPEVAGRQATIRKLLDEYDIDWLPLKYTFKPPILSTIYDLWKLRRAVNRLNRQCPIDIVHCRSHVPALMGLELKKQRGDKIRFVFDMRAFWPDERVEGGSWNLNNPIFRAVYNYFKSKEKEFLTQSDAIVALTHAGKREVQKFDLDGQDLPPIEIIPCCVDTVLFDSSTVSIEETIRIRHELGLDDCELVLAYLGSIGSWYLLDEMLLFFKSVKTKYPTSKFLFVTKGSNAPIVEAAKRLGISQDDLVVKGANREELPAILSVADIGIWFIKACFSKLASSPTKHGEVLAMGIPMICNRGVGDVDELMQDGEAGLLVDDLNEAGFDQAVEQIPRLLALNAHEIRKKSLDHLSLQQGIESYVNLYDSLALAEAKRVDA